MTRILSVIWSGLLVSTLVGCGSDNMLTKQELETQSQADASVAEVLFDAEMDNKASYNVSKGGEVTIEFVPSVTMLEYTRVVEKLRASTDIKSVHAEQSGSTVCILR